MKVRAKKSLGQHFLKDLEAAEKIVNSLSLHQDYDTVLEIGPGMGVLTQFMVLKKEYKTYVVEIDRESVAYMKKNFKILSAEQIIEADFLKLDLATLFGGKPFGIVGNFPYNISSLIFFKAIEYRDFLPEIVCMLQQEVAIRISSPPGGKDYGILSVFLQAYYDIDYIIKVPNYSFDPPPKVQSGVIRLRRNNVKNLDCDEKFFVQVVKTAFNQRRKTLRNALKSLGVNFESPLLELRAERLGVKEFVELTNLLTKKP